MWAVDRLHGKPAGYLTFHLFIDITEHDALFAHLAVANSFSLLRHSWGAVLAFEYVITRQPPGLRRLVDMAASMEL